MKFLVTLVVILFSSSVSSQDKLFTEQEVTVNNHIDGTLLNPLEIDANNASLAIIIAGSGPTNRDGNQNFLKNNSLKKLAEGLSNNGIATFRYDKRIVKQIRQGNVDKNIMFDDFVTDASNVIDFFKAKNAYKKIYVIGHSQGSLVGMLASKDKIDGFVSLAGAGNNIGDVIVEQVTNMDTKLGEEANRVVSKLKSGKTTTEYPAPLASLFGPDLQPFMINWMKYNPTEIIKTIKAPVLIINGTKDLQVSVDEANLLKASNENAQLVIVENMNHVLFVIEGDDLENSKSYNESFRKISPDLVNSILKFIKD